MADGAVTLAASGGQVLSQPPPPPPPLKFMLHLNTHMHVGPNVPNFPLNLFIVKAEDLSPLRSQSSRGQRPQSPSREKGQLIMWLHLN